MAAIIAGVSIMAIAFMAVFLVKICTERTRLKVCEIVQLDTAWCVLPDTAPQAVATEPQGATAEKGFTASNVLVIPGTPACDRIKHSRSRKPA